MVNGYTQLALTKLDVLDSFDEINLVVAYIHKGVELKSYPASLKTLSESLPRFQTVPGWKKNITAARSYADLPAEARSYVELIERLIGVPITVIGVGPARDEVVQKPPTKL